MRPNALFLLAALAAAGCTLARPSDDFRGEPLRPVPPPSFASADAVRRAAAEAPRPATATAEYRVGPGDAVRVTVIGRQELSGEHAVGPDGSISVPLAGPVSFHGRTRAECAELVRGRLSKWFSDDLRVSVDVTRYSNSRVYVLGRVERPGVVELAGGGSLLQVLAEAGGLPARQVQSYLSRCAIVRGRDEIVWIDLQDLLQRGNLSLNVPLVNGDVVYLPDAADAAAFVMGEVRTPGMVPIKVRLTLSQALAQVGGPGEDADLSEVFVVRGPGAAGAGQGVRRVDFRALVEKGDFSGDLELQPGDVVYVGRTGLGDVNYVLRKLVPGVQVAGTALPGVR